MERPCEVLFGLEESLHGQAASLCDSWLPAHWLLYDPRVKPSKILEQVCGMSLTDEATSADTTVTSHSPGQGGQPQGSRYLKSAYTLKLNAQKNELSGHCLYHISGSGHHGRKTSKVLKSHLYGCLYSTQPLSSGKTDYLL